MRFLWSCFCAEMSVSLPRAGAGSGREDNLLPSTGIAVTCMCPWRGKWYSTSPPHYPYKGKCAYSTGPFKHQMTCLR